MTKEEAIKALSELSKSDPELAHISADRILLDFLSANGFDDVASAWTAAEDKCGGFWHS